MLNFFFIISCILMKRKWLKKKINSINFQVAYEGIITFGIMLYTFTAMTHCTWCFVVFLFVHRWPCWQSNVWMRILYYALIWNKLWFPSHKPCCLLLSGKPLLLGTARYSVALFREDSLHNIIIFAHYSIIFFPSLLYIPLSFFNRYIIK